MKTKMLLCSGLLAAGGALAVTFALNSNEIGDSFDVRNLVNPNDQITSVEIIQGMNPTDKIRKDFSGTVDDCYFHIVDIAKQVSQGDERHSVFGFCYDENGNNRLEIDFLNTEVAGFPDKPAQSFSVIEKNTEGDVTVRFFDPM